MTFPTGLPLFELSPSICGMMSAKERAAMIADMIEADVLHLPFPEIAVRFWMPDVMTTANASAQFVTFSVDGALTAHPADPQLVTPKKIGRAISVGSDKIYDVKNDLTANPGARTIRNTTLEEGRANLVVACLDALTMLLLALATRNTVKRTESNTRIKNKHKAIEAAIPGTR